MEKHNLDILCKLAGELDSHLASLIVAYYMLEEPRVLLKDHIEEAYNEKQKKPLLPIIEEHSPSNGSISDFRINSLLVNNFRRFPQLEIPCGLNLVRDKEPKSLILLGGNGVGKSSLYAAFEYVLTNNISEARLRKQKVEQFVKHSGFAAEKKVDNVIIEFSEQETVHSYEDLKKLLGSFHTNTFFCSEWDIISIGQQASEGGNDSKYAFHDFFASNLGFEELVELKNIILKLKDRKDQEKNDIELNLEQVNKDVEECQREVASENRRLVKRSVNAETLNALTECENRLEICGRWVKPEVGLPFLQHIPQESEAKSSDFINSIETYIKEVSSVNLLVGNVLRELDAALELVDGWECTNSIEDIRRKSLRLKDILTELTEPFKDEKEGLKLKKDKLASILGDPHAFSKTCLDTREVYTLCCETISAAVAEIDEMRGRKIKKYSKADFEVLVNLRIKLEKLFARQKELAERKENQLNEQKLREDARLYYTRLEKYLDEQTLEVFTDVRATILNVMRQFNIPGSKETLHIEYINGKISIEVAYAEYKGTYSEEKTDRSRLSPCLYYNTFRYKLFCMMLKMSMALAVMKRNRINFPIILDDVFYASDYHNRQLISFFIKQLYKSYRMVVGNESELQLICFTHDELVMDAIHEAAVVSLKSGYAIFGRLVDYQGVLGDKDSAKEALMQAGNKTPFSNLYIELF